MATIAPEMSSRLTILYCMLMLNDPRHQRMWVTVMASPSGFSYYFHLDFDSTGLITNLSTCRHSTAISILIAKVMFLSSIALPSSSSSMIWRFSSLRLSIHRKLHRTQTERCPSVRARQLKMPDVGWTTRKTLAVSFRAPSMDEDRGD